MGNARKSPKTPKDHPPAWGSPLWQHVALIQELRRKRTPWNVIVAILDEKHGIKTTRISLYRFLKRLEKRKQRRQDLPYGFPSTESQPYEQLPVPKPESLNPFNIQDLKTKAKAEAEEQDRKEKDTSWEFDPGKL